MFRRYRIKRNDYEQVLKWARAQKPDEAEDEKSAEPLGLSMPAQYLPKITWAHKAELQVRSVAHGKHALFVKDGGTWKRLVHEGVPARRVAQGRVRRAVQQGRGVPHRAAAHSRDQ